MVVLPLSRLPMDFAAPPAVEPAERADDVNWLRVSSAVALVTGGALFLAGKPRLALLAAAAGTAVALVDQQEMVKKYWGLLPEYMADMQHVLTQVQETVEEVASQRDKLGRALGRVTQNL